jgi:hypothetical protein
VPTGNKHCQTRNISKLCCSSCALTLRRPAEPRVGSGLLTRYLLPLLTVWVTGSAQSILYSFKLACSQWSPRLPPTFPVEPRGHWIVDSTRRYTASQTSQVVSTLPSSEVMTIAVLQRSLQLFGLPLKYMLSCEH